MKKLISLLLAILIVFSSCLITNNVLAEETDPTSTDEVTEVYDESDGEGDDITNDDEIIDDTSEDDQTDDDNNKDDGDIIDDFIDEIPEDNDGDKIENTGSTEGTAYAVLTDDGDLIFFRSTNTYTDKTKGTFKDIYNNSYSGTIFSGVEDITGFSMPSWQWNSSDIYKPNIKKIYVEPNTTISPKTMYYWFYDCNNLTSFNSTGFDTSNVTNMNSMFYGCSSLRSLDLSSFNTSNVTHMSLMFAYCSSLTSLDLNNFNTSKVSDMAYMFNGCSSLKSLDLSKFNTSNVTDMGGMFNGCSSLKSLDLSKFNTSNVTDMGGMFKGCSSLTSLDLSNFETSKIIDQYSYSGKMKEIFSGCSSLRSLDLSSFNTSNILYMDSMFLNCSSLNTLIIDNFNTSKVMSMYYMFSGCSSLTSLDLSDFNTSNVESMGGMFKGCSSLKSLDLSSFNTSNVIYMSGMFDGCSSLSPVILGPKFTKWINNTYLPEGTWINKEKGLSKSEKELYYNYPSNASSWAGTWIKEGMVEEDDYIHNEFSFRSDILKDGKYTFEYDDSYFFQTNTEYKKNIAKLAVRFAVAAFDSMDGDGFTNIKDFYSKINLTEKKSYNYPTPDNNTIGTAIASKKIYDNDDNEYVLIVCSIRGGNYKYEWVGNFTIGNGVEHEGFNNAATQVMDRIKDFVFDNYREMYNSKRIKILVTGYSRAAGVANLVGKKLDDGEYYSSNGNLYMFNLGQENIYTYCFECPQVGTGPNSSKYNNIYSIINPNDVITKIAPFNIGNNWNYHRYGRDIELPSKTTKGQYDTNYKQKIENLINGLLEYNNYYNPSLAHSIASLSPGQDYILDDLVSTITKHIDKDNYNRLLFQENDGEQLIRDWVDGNLNIDDLKRKYGINDNDGHYALLLKIVSILFPNQETLELCILPMMGMHRIEYCVEVPTFKTIGIGTEYLLRENKITNLFSNQTTRLGQPDVLLAHFPELCMAWVDHYDVYSYSFDNIKPIKFRRGISNCPVNVFVYDNNDVLVASIINEKVQDIEDGLYAFIDADDQKNVILPSDEEYRIEIEPYDSGKLTYSIYEYDSSSHDIEKIISYQELDIYNEDTLTGQIENLSETDEALYHLTQNSALRNPTQSLLGDDIKKYEIKFEVEGCGMVGGGGVYNLGEFCKNKVIDAEENFIGWYEDDNLISTDFSYRFLVNDDRNITAKFKDYIFTDSLSLNKNTLTIEESMTATLDAVLYPNYASKGNLFWYSEDNSIAYVKDGVVTAVSPGTVDIHLATKYGPQLDVVCRVTVLESSQLYGDILEEDRPINPEDIPNGLWYSSTPESDEIYTGKAIKKTFRVYEHKKLLKENTDYTATYKNNINAGKATIAITGKGNYTSTDTIEFNILPIDLNDNSVVISDIDTVKENGKIQKLKPIIKCNGKALNINKDFTVEYNDNYDDRTAYQDPGLYNIVIKGMGNYIGEIPMEYEIAATDQVLVSKLSLTKPKDVVYDGTSKEVDVLLKDGKYTLINGQDYTLSYSDDNVNIGTVTITITGVGKYTGKRTVTFKITGTALSKAKLNNFKSALDYNDELEVLQTVNFTIVDSNKNTVVLNGISKEEYNLLSDVEKKTYDYIYEYKDNIYPGKATVEYTGVNGYTGTIKKTYTITGVALSKVKIDNFVSSYVYDGTNKFQNLSLTYQKDKNSEVKNLELGKDYELLYLNTNKAGNATVTIQGKGLYTGTVKKTYKITPYDLGKDNNNLINIICDNSVPYSKAGAKPGVKVYYNGKLLKKDIDYTLSYSNNTALNDGSNPKKMPTVIVKGKGNFTGTNNTSTFTITKADISDVKVTALDKVYSLKKGAWKSAVTVTDNGKKLSVGSDYDKNVVYTYVSDTQIENGYRSAGDVVQDSDIIPALTEIRVTVTGMNNYYGQNSYIYHIAKADINKCNITVDVKEYTGKPVTLTKDDITVKLGGQMVNPDNYEIDETTYTNNIKKGKATVELKGINDLGSTKKINFTIGPKSFLWWWRNFTQ